MSRFLLLEKVIGVLNNGQTICHAKQLKRILKKLKFYGYLLFWRIILTFLKTHFNWNLLMVIYPGKIFQFKKLFPAIKNLDMVDATCLITARK